MEQKQIELLVLTTLKKAQQGGSSWIDLRMQQLLSELGNPFVLGDPPAPTFPTMDTWKAGRVAATPNRMIRSVALADAVVIAVTEGGQFMTARSILERVRDVAMIYMEPDERMKRRKVSQALYGQKGTRLVSVTYMGRTLWGLPDWQHNGTIRSPYAPDVYGAPDEGESDSE